MYQYAINFIQSIYGFQSLTDSKLILCSHIQNDIVMHMKSEVSIPDIFTYISLHYFNPYTLSAIQLAITQVYFFSYPVFNSFQFQSGEIVYFYPLFRAFFIACWFGAQTSTSLRATISNFEIGTDEDAGKKSWKTLPRCYSRGSDE